MAEQPKSRCISPKGQAYILWAVSSDNRFVRLGQIINVRGRNEAEIRSETTLADFGLLLTMEDLGITKGTVIMPGGRRVGVIEVIRQADTGKADYSW